MKLYRHYDAAGVLLYVGTARDPVKRLIGHEGRSPWADDIATITIESFDTDEAAYKAEAIAVEKERPIYNKRRPPSGQDKKPQEDPACKDCGKRMVGGHALKQRCIPCVKIRERKRQNKLAKQRRRQQATP